MSEGITEIKVDVPPSSSWLQRLRESFKSPYVAYLEARVQALEEREKKLLDLFLVRNGYGGLTPMPQRESKPNVTPLHPWAAMAQREAQAWGEFNEQFPSMEEIAKERKS